MIEKKFSKIIFINPPLIIWPADNSAGIAYLRGFLESKGISTDLIDLNYLIKKYENKFHCLNKLTQQLHFLLSKNNNNLDNLNKTTVFSFHEIYNLSLLAQGSILRYLIKYDLISLEKILNTEEILSPIFKLVRIDNKTNYVGLSINYASQALLTIVIANYLKKKFKHTKIVAGGYVVTRSYKKLIDFFEKKGTPLFDYMIIGEGETPLYKLIKGDDPDKIPNLVAYHITKYRTAKFLDHKEDIRKSPPPLFAPIDFPTLQTSRGCYWNKCRFCSIHSVSPGTNHYRKSPEKVYNDLLYISRKYNKPFNYITFSDDSLPSNFVYNFSKILIEKKLKHFNFRAFLDIKSGFDLKTLKIAKQAGFGRRGMGRISLGMETSTPRLNRLLNKNFTVEEVNKIIKICLELNINLQINFICLLPTQTREEFIADLKFAYDLVKKYRDINKVYILFHQLSLRANSEFAMHPEKFNIKITNKNRFMDFYNIEHSLLGDNLITHEDSVNEFNKFISKINKKYHKCFFYSHR